MLGAEFSVQDVFNHPANIFLQYGLRMSCVGRLLHILQTFPRSPLLEIPCVQSIEGSAKDICWISYKHRTIGRMRRTSYKRPQDVSWKTSCIGCLQKRKALRTFLIKCGMVLVLGTFHEVFVDNALTMQNVPNLTWHLA